MPTTGALQDFRRLLAGGQSPPYWFQLASTNRPLQHDRKVSREWMRQVKQWAGPVRAEIGGQFGYVPGIIHHLYHGALRDRRYVERWRYLTEARYDPMTDLEIDGNGLYRWSDHAINRKHRMVRKIADYFALRKEDAEPHAMPTVQQPEFTDDWFSSRIPQWENHLKPLMGRPVQCLEIGSYEGRSALWMLTRLCTHRKSKLTCVDSWEGEWAHAERRFIANTLPHKQRLRKVKAASQRYLRRMDPESLDFVYIDGSHEGRDVLEDAVLAWRLLKPGGIVCFDDYDWDGQGEEPKDVMPREAIEAFTSVYGPTLEILERGYQLWVQKSDRGSDSGG